MNTNWPSKSWPRHRGYNKARLPTEDSRGFGYYLKRRNNRLMSLNVGSQWAALFRPWHLLQSAIAGLGRSATPGEEAASGMSEATAKAWKDLCHKADLEVMDRLRGKMPRGTWIEEAGEIPHDAFYRLTYEIPIRVAVPVLKQSSKPLIYSYMKVKKLSKKKRLCLLEDEVDILQREQKEALALILDLKKKNNEMAKAFEDTISRTLTTQTGETDINIILHPESDLGVRSFNGTVHPPDGIVHFGVHPHFGKALVWHSGKEWWFQTEGYKQMPLMPSVDPALLTWYKIIS